ncbi:MAG: hypothetical protein FWD57_04795 [Polyangiaceae bacterium]|nr:hypothetical protein [Polyangiaceae bacterium]
MRISNSLVALALSALIPWAAACSSDSDGDGGNGGDGGADTGTGGDGGSGATTDGGPDDADAPDTKPDGNQKDGPDDDWSNIILNPDTGATLQGCYDCALIECEEGFNECYADEQCSQIVRCVLEEPCIANSTIDMTCGLVCAYQAGVNDPTDPAGALALSVGNCILDKCPVECGEDPKP